MDVFELLGLKGTTKILDELAVRDGVRYSDLVRAVGFSTTTTRALKAMEQMEFVEKKVLAEPYRPVIYSLTKKGKQLAEICKQLEDF